MNNGDRSQQLWHLIILSPDRYTYYLWSSIFEGAWVKSDGSDRLRHLVYAGAWKKCEPIWDILIRLEQVNQLLPALESVLMGFTQANNGTFEASQNVPHRLIS